MDTLAVRLAVPLIGPAEVFHLLGLRPAGRTNKKGPPAACLRPLWKRPILELVSFAQILKRLQSVGIIGSERKDFAIFLLGLRLFSQLGVSLTQ